MTTATPPALTLAAFSAAEVESNLSELAALLRACVEDGASISFLLPFSTEEAEDFWCNKIIPAVRSGGLLLLVARQDGRIAGAVQLDCDTPPNQLHRAEVRKLLVHPAFRRRGIARVLMAELERRARGLGRSLLTLDTRSGDKAEPLYRSLGYQTVGIIPGYCRDTHVERLDATTIMYKNL